jgi:hypothetical protein
MMNGEWRGTTAGGIIAFRPGTDFEPSWTEAAGIVLQFGMSEQKNTYTRKLPQGVNWKMGAVFTHDYFWGFFEVIAIS